jgi:hypothetical protein
MVSRGKGRVRDFWRNFGEEEGTVQIISIHQAWSLREGGKKTVREEDHKAVLGGAWKLL